MFCLEKKIRERTFELERSHNELLSALRERELTDQRTKLQIAETVNTIRGLCDTASREPTGIAVNSYFKKIDNTSRDLAEIIEA